MPPGSGGGAILSSLMRSYLVAWSGSLDTHSEPPIWPPLPACAVCFGVTTKTTPDVLLSASAVPSTQMPDLSLPWASGPAPGPAMGPFSFAYFAVTGTRFGGSSCA